MKRAVTIALSMLLFGANAALAQVKPVDPPQPRPPAVDPKASLVSPTD